MRILKILFLALAFPCLQSHAATSIQPDIIIDSESRLGLSSDSVLFYQNGSSVSAFNLLTKKTTSADCHLTTGRIYGSWIGELGNGSYLVYRMRNAGPNEYRVFNKSGSCWDLHSGDSNTVNFVIPDPESNHLIVGIHGEIQIRDINSGDILEPRVGYLPYGHEISARKIVGDKLILFTNAPFKDDYTIQIYDLKNKVPMHSITLSKYYALKKIVDSKIIVSDFDNNIYYLDLQNPEVSLSKIQFSLDPKCARPQFFSKNNMILCGANGSDGWELYSQQNLGDSNVNFLWGKTQGQYINYAATLNMAFMYGRDSHLHLFDFNSKSSSSFGPIDLVNGVYATSNGHLYYSNKNKEVYSFDVSGKINQIYSLAGFATPDSNDITTLFDTTNNVLVYSIEDYTSKKLAIYGVKLP